MIQKFFENPFYCLPVTLGVMSLLTFLFPNALTIVSTAVAAVAVTVILIKEVGWHD